MALGAPNLPKRCQRAPLAACRPANARKRAQDGPCPPNQTGGPLCCHPGGLGFAQLWPKFEVAAPPRAVPRPRGVAHGHFFGWVHGPAEGNRGVFYHPGGLGMQFLRALLQNQACSHPGGVACQEPPPLGAPTPPPGWGVGPLAAGGGLKKIRGVCCHPGGLGWPAQSPGRPRTQIGLWQRAGCPPRPPRVEGGAF